MHIAPIPAILALADGKVFHGIGFGAIDDLDKKVYKASTGEVVFHTGLTGYQEILTDPSYAGQIINFTYPHIGNTGTNSSDIEANKIHAKGLIVKQLPKLASNWRNESTLPEYLASNNVIGIANIDTRSLTRHLRTNGAQNGCILVAKQITPELINNAINNAKQALSLNGADLAKTVTTTKPYVWQAGGLWKLDSQAKIPNPSIDYHIVAYDFGVKHSILRCFNDLNCKITIVPATTNYQTVLDLNPDGIFLSNGPGDPFPMDYAINNIRELIKLNIPIFGICLGCQLLALALGAKTTKMKFGHHGANHPVKDLLTQQVLITSQNHGFCIDENSLTDNLSITHRSLFDKTIQGIEHASKPFFGFQGHPEAGPGPNDARYLFNKFINLITKYKTSIHNLETTAIID